MKIVAAGGSSNSKNNVKITNKTWERIERTMVMGSTTKIDSIKRTKDILSFIYSNTDLSYVFSEE